MAMPALMTADEFLHADFPRHSQLIDGKVVVPEPTEWHEELAFRIVRALRDWIDAGGFGHALRGCNWRIDDRNLFVPDAWWVAEPGRVHKKLWIGGGPDFAIEVRSPSNWVYDLGAKKSHYESVGVRELWLVDTVAETVIIYRRSHREAPEFNVALEVESGERLTSPLLPGFSLAVADLFADPPWV